MAKIERLDDHKILRAHAETQGLDYRNYREALRLHDITLEQAIKDAKEGIILTDRLKLIQKRNRRIKYALKGGLASTVAACIALVSYIFIYRGTDENICSEYIDLKRGLGMLEQVSDSGLDYYCLEAQNFDPEGNVYKRFVEGSRPIVFGRALFGSPTCLASYDPDCRDETVIAGLVEYYKKFGFQ